MTNIPQSIIDRARGVAVGSAVGDAFGMPLEFQPKPHTLIRSMQSGRLPAGTFTDDTEMALALAESLVTKGRFDAEDAALRFLDWFRRDPRDVGIQTAGVLRLMEEGIGWEVAVNRVEKQRDGRTQGNGSLMRAWPVGLAYWSDPETLRDVSRAQSRLTHPHDECQATCAFSNTLIHALLHGKETTEAVDEALALVELPAGVASDIRAIPHKTRDEMQNTGWVRHALLSSLWALVTTGSFEECVIQAANLGDDADTTAAIAGALAGARYGLSAIPAEWRSQLRGEWPIGSGIVWDEARFIELADRLTSQHVVQ
jgi:ADP-ribosyl-[dinitrogen reductase] hydrolase